MSTETEDKKELPKSQQPQNKPGGIAGALTLAITWGWNTYHTYEKCEPAGLVCQEFHTKWFIEDPLIPAALVLLIMYFTGPLFRGGNKIKEGIEQKAADKREFLMELKKYNASRVKRGEE